MLGVGWTEMLLIGVVALIVIGPKDLPMLMQKLGRAIGTIRRMGAEFQRELNKTTGLDQLTDLRASLTEPLKKTAAEITREFNRTTATGVEPTGLIKPANRQAESVVDEIRAASGLLPATPSLAAAPPTRQPAAKAPRTKKVESPAPVEAIAPAPAKKPAMRQAPAKKAAGTVQDQSSEAKSVAKPPAMKPKVAATPKTPKAEA